MYPELNLPPIDTIAWLHFNPVKYAAHLVEAPLGAQERDRGMKVTAGYRTILSTSCGKEVRLGNSEELAS
jgi:hypothetical protein